jgi:hypothetical protein
VDRRGTPAGPLGQGHEGGGHPGVPGRTRRCAICPGAYLPPTAHSWSTGHAVGPEGPQALLRRDTDASDATAGAGPGKPRPLARPAPLAVCGSRCDLRGGGMIGSAPHPRRSMRRDHNAAD